MWLMRDKFDSVIDDRGLVRLIIQRMSASIAFRRKLQIDNKITRVTMIQLQGRPVLFLTISASAVYASTRHEQM